VERGGGRGGEGWGGGKARRRAGVELLKGGSGGCGEGGRWSKVRGETGGGGRGLGIEEGKLYRGEGGV